MRKLLLVGAAVVAAGIFLKRDKVAGLLPSRTPEPYVPPAPGPSNYDAPGPVANTSTPVPAPDPQAPGAIDEAAEEAAAAAEAANIGGTVSDYGGPADLPATEAERPLAEAGEGEAEGQEQAEFDLARAAEPTAPGMSDTERQIEDAIEEAANPLAGERIEPAAPVDEPGAEETGWARPSTEERGAEAPPESLDAPAPGSSAAADAATEEQPAVGQGGKVPGPDEPAPFDPEQSDAPQGGAAKEEEGDDKDDDGGSDWRTWSGRSINP